MQRKKFVICTPILVLCTCVYLMVMNRAFTLDMLSSHAGVCAFLNCPSGEM